MNNATTTIETTQNKMYSEEDLKKAYIEGYKMFAGEVLYACDIEVEAEEDWQVYIQEN